MKFHLDWLKTGRAPRGTPRRRGPRRRLVVLGLIAGLALIQAGCQSGPFGNCGSCSSCGFFKRATDRVLHRDGGCCGSGAVGGVGGRIWHAVHRRQCAVGRRADVRAGAGVGLGALGRAGVARQSDKSRVCPQDADRSAPQRRRCHDRFRGQADGLLHAAIADEDSRPARLGSSCGSRAGGSAPALAARADRRRRRQSARPSAAPWAARRGDSGADIPGPFGFRAGGDHRGREPRRSRRTHRTEADGPAEAATGIARFASVDLRLAGGSLPSAAGLGWLAERGYRTILDLRQSGEVSPAFIADAASRGLRVRRPAGQPRQARSRPARAVQLRAGRARGPAALLLRFRRVARRRPLVYPPRHRRSGRSPARPPRGRGHRPEGPGRLGVRNGLCAAPRSGEVASRRPSACNIVRGGSTGRGIRLIGPDRFAGISDRGGGEDQLLGAPNARCRFLRDRGVAELATGRRDARHRPVSAAGLLDAHGDPRCDREGSGQSAGTGASTTITSPRVG